MHILVVDDDANIRLWIKTMLVRAGFLDTVDVKSAEEAYAYLGLDGAPESSLNRVKLIIMDWVMPKIDGIQACKTIKSKERLKDIPIIMVTARNETDSLETAFLAGAIDFISKPIKRLEMLARVRSALTLKKEMDCRKERECELLEIKQQLELANAELKRLSSEDALTGIPNRRVFDATLEREWRRASRDQSSMSLILVDIDHFKAFNDTCGHNAGDACLTSVAQTLHETVNRPADLVARYGGEEFVVLLPQTHRQGSLFVAEKLRQGVEALQIPHRASPVADHVTISAGCTTACPSSADAARDLLVLADKALYQAKAAGRNQVSGLKIANCELRTSEL